MSTKRPVLVSPQTSVYSSAKLVAFLLGPGPGIATVSQADGLLPRDGRDEFVYS